MKYRPALCVTTAIAMFLFACGDGNGTPATTPTPISTPTVELAATLAAPTTEPSAAAAIVAVRGDLSTRVSEQDARTMPVISITRHDWPDVCLGLGSPLDGLCEQVITPGYEITMGFPLGSTWVFRTDLRSNSSLASVLIEE